MHQQLQMLENETSILLTNVEELTKRLAFVIMATPNKPEGDGAPEQPLCAIAGDIRAQNKKVTQANIGIRMIIEAVEL